MRVACRIQIDSSLNLNFFFEIAGGAPQTVRCNTRTPDACLYFSYRRLISDFLRFEIGAVFDRLIDVNFSENNGSIHSDDFMEELIACLKSLQSFLHFE